MNGKMLASGPVQEHIKILKEARAEIVDPDSGLLACGYEGKGRMPSAAVINDYVMRALCDKKDFAGRRVAVTAGPTHEYIDPVRFISNPSSGKMGYAIAEEAWRRGAEVTLITGPTALRRPAGINIVEVTSADEMFDACMEASESAGVIVKAAAVGDYRPAERAEQKIKRGGKDTMTLELVQNRDIAAELGRRKRPGQLLVGFAAETQNVLENAQKKMAEKNLDMIVSNDVLAPGAGFAVDTNAVTIMARGAEPVRFSERRTKRPRAYSIPSRRSPPGNNALGSRRISGPLVDAALLLVGDGARRGASRIRAARTRRQDWCDGGRGRRLRRIEDEAARRCNRRTPAAAARALEADKMVRRYVVHRHGLRDEDPAAVKILFQRRAAAAHGARKRRKVRSRMLLQYGL